MMNDEHINGTHSHISFTNDHVEKIRNGEKTTTLRTVKRGNLYPVGRVISVNDDNDLTVKIISRDVLYLTEDDVLPFDAKYDSSPVPSQEELADSEGFAEFGDLIDWFQGSNPFGVRYTIPQPFFYYRFEPMIH